MLRIGRTTAWLIGIGMIVLGLVVFNSDGFTSARGTYRGTVRLRVADFRDQDPILRYALVLESEAPGLLANPNELEARWKPAPLPGTSVTAEVMGAFSSDPGFFRRHVTRDPYADTVLLECRSRNGEIYVLTDPINWNAAKTSAGLVVAAKPPAD